VNITFDIPFKETEFQGVPYKGIVPITPCVNCLVSLQEQPWFVLDLSEVEIVVLERCMLQLREFDMVFVKKNYEEPPVRVSTVPSQHLDRIKCWLNEIELVYYTCTMNMMWPMVMKEITKDPQQFIEHGGWNAWFPGNDSGESDSNENDGESDYNNAGDEEPSDDDDPSGADDGDSDFDASDDDASDEPDDSEESGLSWDELEKQAEKSDRKRGHKDDGDERKKPSKRPRR